MNRASRAQRIDLNSSLPATGGRIDLNRDEKCFFALTSATTTAATIPAASSAPAGLVFFLDNSNGSGTMTITPDSGSVISVTTGKVFMVVVAASGVYKSIDLAS
jgi:hypothetical protein